MSKARTSICALSAISFLAVGCAPEAGEEEVPAADPVAEAPAMAVTIETPANGATVAGPDVEVTLSVTGVEVVPVAEGRMETAHHHLYLDVDLTPLGQPIPLENSSIVHMGDGRSNHTFEALEPGPHRIIALLADPTHTPFDPPVADTVEFTVSGQE